MNQFEESRSERCQGSLAKDRTGNESFQRCYKTGDGREVFSTGSPFIFMGTSEENRVWKQRRTGEKGSGSARTVKFVRAD